MMNEWKKIGLPILLTFIASFVLNYIIFYRDMDFSEQQNIIRSIDDLKSRKADREELNSFRIESKEYVDKEVSEARNDLKGDVKDIKEMIQAQKKNSDAMLNLFKEYVDAKTE